MFAIWALTTSPLRFPTHRRLHRRERHPHRCRRGPPTGTSRRAGTVGRCKLRRYRGPARPDHARPRLARTQGAFTDDFSPGRGSINESDQRPRRRPCPRSPPSLWFDHNLEEAAESTPRYSRTRTSRISGPEAPMPAPASPVGSVRHLRAGREPIHRDQWRSRISRSARRCPSRSTARTRTRSTTTRKPGLTMGAKESQCGWCKDRFGLSWQVIPGRLYDLVVTGSACATAATQAM